MKHSQGIKISSLLPYGSGASVVHKALSRKIKNYTCQTYNPRYEFFPPLLLGKRKLSAGIMHAPPDHAILVTPRDSSLVLTFHGYFLDQAFSPYNSLFQKLHYKTDLLYFTKMALKRAKAVTAVSDYIANIVKEDLKFPGDIAVIPNGVDENKFSPNPKSHFGTRVLFCANLSQRKGAHLLPKIATHLDAGIELWIASGLRGRSYFNKVLPSNIKLLGPIQHEDMPKLYNSVDMLITPTKREGFGLTVAEAMATGIPVIASKNSSMPQLIADGKGGYLVPEDCPASFADRINYLAKNPSLTKKMGLFNRNRILERYTEDEMVKGYEKLFSHFGCVSTEQKLELEKLP